MNWWKIFGITLICVICMIFLALLLSSAGTEDGIIAAWSSLWYVFIIGISIYSSIKIKTGKEMIYGIAFCLVVSFLPIILITIAITTIHTAWTFMRIERYKIYGKSPLVKL
jgi:phosphatidylserine synthase